MYWHVFLGGWSDGCLPYRQYVVSRWMRVVPLVTSYPSSIRTLPDFSIIVFWFRSVALSPRPSLRCGMCPSGVHQSVSKSDTQNPPLIWWNLMETLGDSMFKGRLEYLYLQGLCSIQWGCCGDKVASNHTATKHHHSYPFLPIHFFLGCFLKLGTYQKICETWCFSAKIHHDLEAPRVRKIATRHSKRLARWRAHSQICEVLSHLSGKGARQGGIEKPRVSKR